MPAKKYRDLWLSKGLCGECGKHPLVEGKNYCSSCIDYKRLASIRKLERKKENGICNDCRNPRAENSSFCESCLAKRREYNKTRRITSGKNNTCPNCGKPSYKTNKLCKQCLDKKLKPAHWHEVLDQETNSTILVQENLVGKTFAGQTVLEYSYRNKNHHYWLCQCECGELLVVCQVQLKKQYNRCPCQRGNE